MYYIRLDFSYPRVHPWIDTWQPRIYGKQHITGILDRYRALTTTRVYIQLGTQPTLTNERKQPSLKEEEKDKSPQLSNIHILHILVRLQRRPIKHIRNGLVVVAVTVLVTASQHRDVLQVLANVGTRAIGSV
jgi:hypothetical protein